MQKKSFEIEIGGKKLTAEFSPLASQANGSVLIKYGETVVLSNAVMSKRPKEGARYFPLSVDYEEKFYAAGRIPGSRFLRREARPSEEAILNSRFIDRTTRPLFDHRMRYDLQISAFVLSIDNENDPDMAAVLGSSLALSVSDIPWNGPVGTVRVIKKSGNFIINPSYKEREGAEFDMIISGRIGKINMIEGNANEASEEDLLKGMEIAGKAIESIIEFQNKIKDELGKEKITPIFDELSAEVHQLIENKYKQEIEKVFSQQRDKFNAGEMLSEIKENLYKELEETFPDESKDVVSDVFESIIDKVMHTTILKTGLRPDGRKTNELRELYTEAGILPRTHGSGLFFRGDTHILSLITLGPPSNELLIDSMTGEKTKRFMHHYNFPPFSVGEVGRMGSPGRREIGHGALAEKALMAIIPPVEDFPYAIRAVSETLSSNGSSSMGSVCASCIALMDAGVPIKEPVAGIAMGLIVGEDGNYKVLTDIQGPEDHHGDMDFKVAGSKKGVTAIQMDVKVSGVTLDMLRDAFSDAKNARLAILDKITEAIPSPRKDLSPHAPRVIKIMINPEKIKDVIGPGGKTINGIIRDTGAQIDIEQDGTVFISSSTLNRMEEAVKKVDLLTKEFAVGEEAEGKVSRTLQFGAMVEIAPGREGLVHISELADYRVKEVEDVAKIGDTVKVKIIGIDEFGRINLSMKSASGAKN